MKKFIIAAVAASLISTPVLAAPMPQQQGQQDRNRVEQSDRSHQAQRGPEKRNAVQRDARAPVKAQSWSKGDRFDSRKAVNYRVIDNPRAHHLDDAPRGYRWVQSDGDAVLVGIASGIIAAVIANSIN